MTLAFKHLQPYLLLGAVLAMTQSACANLAFHGEAIGVAFIYADTNLNKQVTHNKMGSKHGEACALSVLGWVTTGDASVAAAAKEGQITEVASVDNHYTCVLGLYSRYCTLVSGE